jgi:hypothetical protein
MKAKAARKLAVLFFQGFASWLAKTIEKKQNHKPQSGFGFCNSA